MRVNESRNSILTIIFGVLSTVLTGAILIGIMTKLQIDRGINEDTIEYLILFTQGISVMVGCIVPMFRDKHRNMARPAMIALGDFAFIFGVSLLIDGTFRSFVATVAVIVIGGVLSCIIYMKRPQGNRAHKKRYR